LWRAANGRCYFPPQFRESIIVGKWEIVRRGRAAWHFDKNGKISCAWIAKSIILRSRERVARVKFPEGEIDIDTREDWEELNDGSTSPETMPKDRRSRKVNYADRKR